jgi:hypothetical protein
VNKIKDAALNSTETGHYLLANQSLNLSRSVARELPSMSAIKCAMQRARNQVSGIPRSPISLLDFILPETFKVTIVGERFLINDNEDTDNRMMIFATKEFLGYLSSSKTWFADGMFKTASQLFQQLFTILFLRKPIFIICAT